MNVRRSRREVRRPVPWWLPLLAVPFWGAVWALNVWGPLAPEPEQTLIIHAHDPPPCGQVRPRPVDLRPIRGGLHQPGDYPTRGFRPLGVGDEDAARMLLGPSRITPESVMDSLEHRHR
jgi:hypothetical protein